MYRKKKIIIILITLLVIAFVFEAFNNFRNVTKYLNKIDESIPITLKKKLLDTVLVFKKVEILKKQLAQKDSDFQDFLVNPEISITYNFRKEANIEKKRIANEDTYHLLMDSLITQNNTFALGSTNIVGALKKKKRTKKRKKPSKKGKSKKKMSKKKGKKRMRSIGRVDIPQEAFLAVLHID